MGQSAGRHPLRGSAASWRLRVQLWSIMSRVLTCMLRRVGRSPCFATHWPGCTWQHQGGCRCVLRRAGLKSERPAATPSGVCEWQPAVQKCLLQWPVVHRASCQLEPHMSKQLFDLASRSFRFFAGAAGGAAEGGAAAAVTTAAAPQPDTTAAASSKKMVRVHLLWVQSKLVFFERILSLWTYMQLSSQAGTTWRCTAEQRCYGTPALYPRHTCTLAHTHTLTLRLAHGPPAHMLPHTHKRSRRLGARSGRHSSHSSRGAATRACPAPAWCLRTPPCCSPLPACCHLSLCSWGRRSAR